MAAVSVKRSIMDAMSAKLKTFNDNSLTGKLQMILIPQKSKKNLINIVR